MNHFDEMACLLYLEGQLDPARARELVCAHRRMRGMPHTASRARARIARARRRP